MHAANVVLQPSQHEGIPFPAERRVAPTGFHNKALSWPVLIHIHVNEYALGAI